MPWEHTLSPACWESTFQTDRSSQGCLIQVKAGLKFPPHLSTMFLGPGLRPLGESEPLEPPKSPCGKKLSLKLPNPSLEETILDSIGFLLLRPADAGPGASIHRRAKAEVSG